MKKLITLFLLLIILKKSYAQNIESKQIDSLKHKLILSIDDTSKVRLLGKLSFEYFRFDTDSGIYYAEKAIKLAEKVHWELGLAFSYNYMGTNYAVKGNYPKALEFFNKSLSKYTDIDDKQGIAFVSNNLGNFYRMQKQYHKAIEFINKAILINAQVNNKKELTKNYNNLGNIFTEIPDYSKSNEAYSKSLKIAEETNNTEHIALLLINIAENKVKMKDYCTAIELCNKAINMSEKLEITYDLAVYNGYLGEIYFGLSCDSTMDTKNCLYYSNNKLKNLNLAKKHLIISIELLDKIKDLSVISGNSLLLSQVYEKLGDTKNALKYYKNYSANKDSIYSADNSIKIADLEKKREMELRDNQIKIQTMEIDKKNTRNIFQMVLFILILIVISFVSYYYYKKRLIQKSIQEIEEREKADEALRASEEKYRNIFNNAQEGIFQTTFDGSYISVNPALAKMYGYELPEELIQSRKDISKDSYYNPKERDNFLRLMEEKGFVKGYEYEVNHKDGHKIWVYEDAKAIKDENGKVQYFEGFVIDITDRRHAEEALAESKRILQNVLDSIPVRVFWKDLQGAYLGCNKLFAKDAGRISPNDVIGDIDINMPWKKQSEAYLRDDREVAINGKMKINYEETQTTPEGKTIWLKTSKIPLRDNYGKLYGVLGTYEDITDRKIADLLLKEKNEKIEMQNVEYLKMNEVLIKINEELISAKERAEESDNLKSSFMQNMSHEVRTPLNAIVGFSKFFIKSNQPVEKLKKFSEMISISSEKLIGIINDVIEISQIHSKQIKAELSEIDVISSIKTIADRFTKKTKDTEVEFKLDLNIPHSEYFILSDSEKFNKVCVHLIDNAFKFTSQGYVKISCQIQQERLIISIADTGIGISDKMQTLIFEPFRQIETGTCRTYGGNGLGLPIAKAYTELLDGSISLKSEINKGTTINLSFPVKKHSPQTIQNTVDIKEYTTKTILFAEDESSNYHLFLEKFDSTKLKILHAHNGKEAIDFCRENSSIDLILMDIKMPIMDGHKAAKLIKEFRPEIPIIAHAEYALNSEKEKFIGVFDDYITKPINELELKKILTKYIEI